MLHFYYVSFAGHRRVDDFCEVDKKLEQIILDLLRTKDFGGAFNTLKYAEKKGIKIIKI